MAKWTDPKLRVPGAALPDKAFLRPGPGPAPLRSTQPSGCGEVGGSARRPACNDAGAPHCRRKVRGPPGPMPGRDRTRPLQQVHPGRLRQPRTSGGQWRASHNRPCGRPLARRSGCPLWRRRAFLPPDTAPAAARAWTAWDPSQGTTLRPRSSGRPRKPRVVRCPDGAHRPNGGIGCRPGLRAGGGFGRRPTGGAGGAGGLARGPSVATAPSRLQAATVGPPDDPAGPTASHHRSA